MKIDFENEVLKRKKDIISDLQGLIKINSELTTFDANRKMAPFGEGIKESLEYMLELGKKDGFITENVDGYAGHIVYGGQMNYVGSIGHLDVVPAGNDWTYPPYGAEIHDNKMYGRGTEDDKGPTIAFYYAMKILKELGVSLSKRIKLILATDEETAWRGINYYYKKYPEQPVSGFIPDADFPLIYAEKGIATFKIEGEENIPAIISIKGGFRANMVPDYCEVKVCNNVADKFKKEFEAFLALNAFSGSIQEKKDGLLITVKGKSAHAATPDFGVNAIWIMFDFLRKVTNNSNLVEIISNLFENDTKGLKLGINHEDKEMGFLTNNLGVINYDNGHYEITTNIRYPKGIEHDFMFSSISAKVKKYDAKTTALGHIKLLYCDPNGEMVIKLMDIYKKHTKDFSAKPIVIGGGTFARAMNNTVAFGPHFDGKPTFVHQRDEYIDIDDFLKAIIIYTESLYELAK